MRLGDVLELAGAACLATAAGLIAGVAAAVIVVGVFLLYVAQCHGATPFRLPKASSQEEADAGQAGEPT